MRANHLGKKCYPEARTSLKLSGVFLHPLSLDNSSSNTFHPLSKVLHTIYWSNEARERSKPWEGRPGEPCSFPCRTPQRSEAFYNPDYNWIPSEVQEVFPSLTFKETTSIHLKGIRFTTEGPCLSGFFFFFLVVSGKCGENSLPLPQHWIICSQNKLQEGRRAVWRPHSCREDQFEKPCI